MNEEQEREKFEAWFVNHDVHNVLPIRWKRSHDPSLNGKYVRTKIELAWEAWKAAKGIDS